MVCWYGRGLDVSAFMRLYHVTRVQCQTTPPPKKSTQKWLRKVIYFKDFFSFYFRNGGGGASVPICKMMVKFQRADNLRASPLVTLLLNRPLSAPIYYRIKLMFKSVPWLLSIYLILLAWGGGGFSSIFLKVYYFRSAINRINITPLSPAAPPQTRSLLMLP